MNQTRLALRCPPALLSAALALPLCLTVVSLGDDDPMGAPPAPPAGAKDAPPAGQPAQGSGDKGVLGGPKVPPGAAKDAPPFGQGARGERGPGQQRPGEAVRKAMAEERVFMMTIDGMMDGFTPDQQSQITAIRKDFEGKRKAWRDANGEQLREIEEAMRERREGAGKPDPTLLEKAEKLRASMPDSKEMQSKVFAVLTPDQQAAFKTAYAENEKRAAERMRGRQQGGPGGPGGPSGDGAPAGGPGGRGKGRGQKGDGAGGPPPKAPPGAEPPKDRNYGFDKPGAPAGSPPAP